MLIPNLSILVCANQASEEGPLPSHYLPSVVSTTSSPFLVVASTKISGLINTTTSKNIAKGSIQTQSTTNGINVGKFSYFLRVWYQINQNYTWRYLYFSYGIKHYHTIKKKKTVKLFNIQIMNWNLMISNTSSCYYLPRSRNLYLL